jgi:hypothetical protein
VSGLESAVLLHAVASAERGPRRDGAFALWLVVRVVGDIAGETGWPERSHRRRLQALERRLTSLSLSPPLRRALGTALAQLREFKPENAPAALAPLVGPVRESVGAEAAEAIRRGVAGLRGR